MRRPFETPVMQHCCRSVMMQDKELLEGAAKAAGLNYEPMLGGYYTDPEFNEVVSWNPLTNDGDALRLAVRLNIPVIPYDDETSTGTVGVVAKNWGSKEANTRRAIVRAAAAIAAASALGAA